MEYTVSELQAALAKQVNKYGSDWAARTPVSIAITHQGDISIAHPDHVEIMAEHCGGKDDALEISGVAYLVPCSSCSN